MLFTPETARHFAAIGVAKRAAMAAQQPDGNRIYRAKNPKLPSLPPANPPPVNAYVFARRARVRKQLNLVDRAIEREASKDEPDGQRLNWLASAQERLAEQERQLDNRPAPGTLRPPSQRITRGAALAAPEIPDQPQVSPARAVSPQPSVAAASTAPTAPQPNAIEDPQREA
jgi:hypothetical protein